MAETDYSSLIDLLSRGAGIASGYKAADQYADALDQSWQYNKQNQERVLDYIFEQNDLLRALSERLQGEAKLGMTDTRGNTMKYVEGVGWVQTAAPRTADLQRASDTEELARLTADNAMRRRGMLSDEQQRLREGSQAESVLRQLQQPNTISRDAILGALSQARGRGINEAYDKTSRDFATQSTRAGSSAVPGLTELAKQRGRELGDAYNSATVDSYGIADNLTNSRNSNLGNLYNLFAGRASGYNNANFSPSSGNFAADADTNSVQRAASIGAAYRMKPEFTPIQPNVSQAYGTQSKGQAAGGLLDIGTKLLGSFF